MKLTIIALLSAVSLGLFPASSNGQQSRDTVALQIGALRYVRGVVAKGRVIAVDTTSAIDFRRGRPAQVAQVSQEAIVTALGSSARRAAGSELIVCRTPGDFYTCAMRNADIVVTLSIPTILGDTAYVPLRIQERQVGHRPFSEAREAIRFVRKSGGWVFSSVNRMSVT